MNSNLTVREITEQAEHLTLCERAAFSDACRGRAKDEEKCPLRTDFQRDRDRIIHCKSFRRLKHKTQVFLSPEGDHYRTRLTHTLEVSQIARTIARALRLNEDLTEAIALGHDLGHTPFGHAGERALNDCCSCGFRHYEQSVRVVEVLEDGGKGLNLTDEVRNGIDRHTSGEWAYTLEGRVVRYADRIAYINHDIDDAIRAGVLRGDDIPKEIRDVLGNSKSERIDTLVFSTVRSSGDDIAMQPDVAEAYNDLHAFLFENVYKNPVAKGEEDKVDGIIKHMFEYYVRNPDKLPAEYYGTLEREGAERAAADHIAGMTDRFAIQVYNNLFIPRSWGY